MAALEGTDVLLSWTVNVETLEVVANAPLVVPGNLLDIAVAGIGEVIVSVHCQVHGHRYSAGDGAGEVGQDTAEFRGSANG